MLLQVFQDINLKHFDGFLDAPVIRWNSRLRTSAGRFVPGSRKHPELYPAAIEVASYLLQETDPEKLVSDTIAHEMIHYWLWVRRRPYGHTEEFMVKMREMGATRWNPVPRRRPYKYAYRCGHCAQEFLSRKRLGTLGCGKCCKKHSGGRFDSRFKLVFDRQLDPADPAAQKGAKRTERETPYPQQQQATEALGELV